MENVDNKEEKKATYEQLKEYCNNLYLQNQQLAARLNQVTQIMSKLPFLFEVVKAKDNFNIEFVNNCIAEIEFILTEPKEESAEESKENK